MADVILRLVEILSSDDARALANLSIGVGGSCFAWVKIAPRVRIRLGVWRLRYLERRHGPIVSIRTIKRPGDDT